jgi:YD repeat-containing protein
MDLRITLALIAAALLVASPAVCATSAQAAESARAPEISPLPPDATIGLLPTGAIESQRLTGGDHRTYTLKRTIVGDLTADATVTDVLYFYTEKVKTETFTVKGGRVDGAKSVFAHIKGTTVTEAYAYDANGRLSTYTESAPSGWPHRVTSYVWNEEGRLTEATLKIWGKITRNWSYTYDTNGRLDKITVKQRKKLLWTETLTYNAAGQLHRIAAVDAKRKAMWLREDKWSEAKENQPSRLLEISVRAQDAAGDLIYIDRFKYAAAE